MTQERKDELYDRMIYMISENARDDNDLYKTLVNGLGMTQEELHEHGITQLDEFFPKQRATEKLHARLDECYKKWVRAWLTWMPQEIIDHCDEVESITRMAKTAARNLTEEDAEYLLRFEDPLEVLADQWRERFDMDVLIIDDDLSKIVWRIRDQGLEDEYETVDQKGPEMCM